MATMREVAERAGVSSAVVSAAISGSTSVRMSEATRARVQRAVEELGYRANHAARSLRSSRSGMVTAIVPELTNPIFEEALRGIQDAAEESRTVVLISDASRVSPGSNLMERLVGTGMTDGFILRLGRIGEERIEEFEARGVPCVLMNNPYGRHAAVWVDDTAGIEAAVGRLLDQGHRRVSMLSGMRPRSYRDTRRAGFQAAFHKRGLRAPVSSIVHTGYQPEDVGQRFIELMAGPRPPQAVVVDNVLAARGVSAACHDRGIDVPGDVSIIAYHDIAEADYFRPALDTVKMPVYEAGRASFAALHRMIEGRDAEARIVIEPAPFIVSRGSTRDA